MTCGPQVMPLKHRAYLNHMTLKHRSHNLSQAMWHLNACHLSQVKPHGTQARPKHRPPRLGYLSLMLGLDLSHMAPRGGLNLGHMAPIQEKHISFSVQFFKLSFLYWLIPNGNSIFMFFNVLMHFLVQYRSLKQKTSNMG